MKRSRVVIKIGGRAMEAPGATRELASAIGSLPGEAIVVHGGGAEVSAWSGRLGIPPRFVDGLRVTDTPTLEVVVAVLAGLANKRLVAELREAVAVVLDLQPQSRGGPGPEGRRNLEVQVV